MQIMDLLDILGSTVYKMTLISMNFEFGTFEKVFDNYWQKDIRKQHIRKFSRILYDNAYEERKH